jgi:hypothetical protein
MPCVTRMIWLLTGVTWAARSAMEFAQPDYWDPMTALDWSAIWIYSAAWLLFAPSVLLLGRLAPSRPVMIVAAVVAFGAIVAGGANAIEDGLGFASFGPFYVVGFMTAWIGLLSLATVLRRAHQTRLAALSVLLFAGVLLFLLGGGLIILAGWSAVAIAPTWFSKLDIRAAAPA